MHHHRRLPISRRTTGPLQALRLLHAPPSIIIIPLFRMPPPPSPSGSTSLPPTIICTPVSRSSRTSWPRRDCELTSARSSTGSRVGRGDSRRCLPRRVPRAARPIIIIKCPICPPCIRVPSGHRRCKDLGPGGRCLHCTKSHRLPSPGRHPTKRPPRMSYSRRSQSIQTRRRESTKTFLGQKYNGGSPLLGGWKASRGVRKLQREQVLDI